jgi:hypothetical protein
MAHKGSRAVMLVADLSHRCHFHVSRVAMGLQQIQFQLQWQWIGLTFGL